MSRARLWTCLSLFIYRIFPTCLYPALFSFFLYPTSFTVFLPFSGIFTLLFWYFPLLFWYFPPPILVFFPSCFGIFPRPIFVWSPVNCIELSPNILYLCQSYVWYQNLLYFLFKFFRKNAVYSFRVKFSVQRVQFLYTVITTTKHL